VYDAYRFLSLTCLDCEKFVWLIAQRKVPKGGFCVVMVRLRGDYSLMFLYCRYVYGPTGIEITMNEITN